MSYRHFHGDEAFVGGECSQDCPGGQMVETQSDVIHALEQRVMALEQQSRRMKMGKIDLLRLEDGDILVLRVQRPLASSEQAMIVNGFRNLFAAVGKKVEVAVVCGMDKVELEVVRAA